MNEYTLPYMSPCPFCGSTDLFISYDDNWRARWVVCAKCECNGPLLLECPPTMTAQQSIDSVCEKWNERT